MTMEALVELVQHVDEINRRLGERRVTKIRTVIGPVASIAGSWMPDTLDSLQALGVDPAKIARPEDLFVGKHDREVARRSWRMFTGEDPPESE